MSVQDKYAAQKKYDRANTQVFTFKLNKNTDASIIEWLKTNIMQLPDVKRFAKGVAVDYSGYKNRLLSYIDDKLISLDTTATQNYADYIKQNEAELVSCFETIIYSSLQQNVEAAYRKIFDILKGGEALTIEEAKEAEELNEYYEDFEDVY